MSTTAKNLRLAGISAWRQSISAAFYEQDVVAEPETPFNGALAVWRLGPISLSHIVSSPVTYRRLRQQIATGTEACHLMTIPLAGELYFEQRAVPSRCGPKSLLAERGDLPYELHQPGFNELIVLKIPESLLSLRLPRGATLAGRVVPARSGGAALLVDHAQSIVANVDALDPSRHALLGEQLLDLLGLALSAADGALESGDSSVLEAHFRRIVAAARSRLCDPKLSPAVIAAHCGISTRYLHRIFAMRGTSLGRWILEERLLAADAALGNPRYRESIAALAHRLGFSDQPQFCRRYKRRFGRTPSEGRALDRQSDG